MRHILLILLFWGMASGQLPPLIDREIFFGDPELVGVEVSPDGRWISYLKPYKGTLNIWLQRIQDGELGDAFPITASERRPITQYFWSYDSRYVLYSQDKDGDENYHLYRISLAEVGPGKIPQATDMTPGENIRVVLYGLPKEKPQIAYLGINKRDPTLHDLYELNIPTGGLRLLYENREGILGWAIDALGRIRFAQKMGPEGETQLFEVKSKGSNFSFKKIYETTWEEAVSIAQVPRKGKVIYLITNKGVDKSRLVTFDPTTGKEQEIHTDPLNRVDLGSALFDEKTDKLRMVSYLDDKRRRYFFDSKLEKWFKKWESLLPEGEVGLTGLSDEERYAVVVYTSDREPGRYYLWDAQKEILREIGKSRPNLPSEHLSEMRPIRIRTRDGAELPAYLTLPKGITPKNLPAVLYVHGGPWARDDWGYDGVVQFLANRGYAVLQVNFRASTGYGKAFLNAGNKQWGTGIMQHDLTDAVQQLIREGIFDPHRIAIMGGSYGGYATLAGVTFTPELYACGISIVGPSSIITLIRSVPPYWKPLIKVFHNRVGNPDDPQDLERLKAQSPLYHIERIQVPLLIIQGANDPRVKQQESDQIVAALHAKGYPVRYLLAPDEGHGFQNYDNRMAMMVAIEQFLSERLGGRLQPEVPEKIAKRLQAISVDPSTVKIENSSRELSQAALSLRITSPLKSRWIYQVSLRGRQVSAKATEEWKKVPTGWEYVESVESEELPTLRTADTLKVDERGELLSYQRIQQGVQLSLRREGEQLKGDIEFMGQKNSLSQKLNGKPAYPTNSALRYYLASLPLMKGYTATFPLFSFQQGTFQDARVRVEDEEKITVGGQERYTWKIHIEAEGVKQTIWIDKDTGLPWRTQASIGGASMIGDRIE